MELDPRQLTAAPERLVEVLAIRGQLNAANAYPREAHLSSW